MRRILSIAVITVAGTIGLMATATSAGAGTKPDVDAVLECIILNGDSGDFVAVFGYQNNGVDKVEIPIGTDNKFTTKPEDRGQPTTFAPGRQQNAFKVESTGSLQWHLPGKNAVANRNSKQCETPPVPTGNDSPQAVVLIAAAAGVIVVGGGASSWWISRRKRRAA